MIFRVTWVGSDGPIQWDVSSLEGADHLRIVDGDGVLITEMPFYAASALQLALANAAMIASSPAEKPLRQRDLPDPERRGSSSYIEAVRAKHARAYERWTAEQDAELLAMRGNYSIGQMAAALERQPGAIRSRLLKLGYDPNGR